jgi:hypothetical protein
MEQDNLNQQLHLPERGAVAPDFSLPAIDGLMVKLSSYPKPVALIFMRHLA